MSDWKVLPDPIPQMGVRVEKDNWWHWLPIQPAHMVWDRWDLIVITGWRIEVIRGMAEPNPRCRPVPPGTQVIGAVFVPAACMSIHASHIYPPEAPMSTTTTWQPSVGERVAVKGHPEIVGTITDIEPLVAACGPVRFIDESTGNGVHRYPDELEPAPKALTPEEYVGKTVRFNLTRHWDVRAYRPALVLACTSNLARHGGEPHLILEFTCTTSSGQLGVVAIPVENVIEVVE